MKKVIIVGSGAGGATLAKELTNNGVDITIIEKGPWTAPGEAYQQYQNLDTDVEILKTECIGGSTLVSAGNAVRTSEKVLKRYKVDIVQELNEVERELRVKTLSDSLMGNGTKKITRAALNLGFPIKKMPKFIDPNLCKPCGKCVLSCPRNAKWTANEFIEEASQHGATIIENSPVTEILHEQGKIRGVKCKDQKYYADQVILSAGAIETARLLQKAKIEAGQNLFVDTFVTVGGVLPNIGFNEEISMFSLLVENDIILSPHYTGMLLEPLKKFDAQESDILGLMIKIKDDNLGEVTQNSAVKFNTSRDTGLLTSGAAMAGAILTEAGVNPNTLISTPARGAHPGGTAAIGSVVDHNLETEIEGLFVADASVLPEAPGAPPILTILALSKRLAHYISSH